MQAFFLFFVKGVTVYRKCEIRIRIGFISQSEMPPLCRDRLKTVVHHGFPQDHAVFILLLCKIGIIGMAELSEIVECSAHIRFFLRLHVKQCQIYRTSAAVTGMAGNIPLRKE